MGLKFKNLLNLFGRALNSAVLALFLAAAPALWACSSAAPAYGPRAALVDVPLPNDESVDVIERQLTLVVSKTNELRSRQGARPLKWNASLAAYAFARAKESSVKFAHTRPDGSGALNPIFGGRHRGENLAMNHSMSGEGAVEQWRRSPGHYANLVKREFTDIGVGVYVTPKREVYWCQIFGTDGARTNYRFVSIPMGAPNPVIPTYQSVGQERAPALSSAGAGP